MSDKNGPLLISQSVCAMIKALGLHAENKQREALGQSMAYDEKAFFDLIDEHGIGWNEAVTMVRHEQTDER